MVSTFSVLRDNVETLRNSVHRRRYLDPRLPHILRSEKSSPSGYDLFKVEDLRTVDGSDIKHIPPLSHDLTGSWTQL